ncbi:MAG: acyltransferase family protein [bacterium]|nr:acyltransferase family protein [bacterium]
MLVSIRETQPAPARERLLYLDNLRTFLTALVICHHAAIAAGATGGWYWALPAPPDSESALLLTVFTAVNQAFFMSLFFAISAYVTPASYDAKGAAAFLRDRFARLGIPLVVYFFVLNPILSWLIVRLRDGDAAGLVAFVSRDYGHLVGPGPLWFVLALLVFGSAYAAARVASGHPREVTGTHPFPSDRTILGFVVGIGLTAFLVRFVFPTGWDVLGLQLGYFPLYVAFFTFGLRAHANRWLDGLDRPFVACWGRRARWAMPLLLATPFVGGIGQVNGGPHLAALLYAMWEPWICVGMSAWLLVLFRERWATQGRLARRLSRGAYTAYIVHPFFVVAGTALVALLPPQPLLRFVVLCALAVPATFAVADGIRRLPGLSRIL